MTICKKWWNQAYSHTDPEFPQLLLGIANHAEKFVHFDSCGNAEQFRDRKGAVVVDGGSLVHKILVSLVQRDDAIQKITVADESIVVGV